MESVASVAGPEAVAGTQPVYAGFWIRAGAYILDYMLTSVLGLILGFVLGVLFAAPLMFVLSSMGRTLDLDLYSSIAGYLVGFPAVWCYFALFEASKYQGTPGKLALGLRVTDEAGGRITFGRASTRFFSKLLSALLLCIGFIMVGTSARKQGLHDRIAHTLVVRTR